ncbi:hypothetical protein QTI66_22805 [Variovorax sp. J22R133]|uniref:hypothetical protein n=1 Tax=Variovorax brevis TaxID=3053503 RepID=UPI002576FFE8|nr:hypothetical protein [Variovorax sp. J22R133]MDM0114997.1 hypothetical protein [Variovorax sp. J22R133]
MTCASPTQGHAASEAVIAPWQSLHVADPARGADLIPAAEQLLAELASNGCHGACASAGNRARIACQARN